MQEEQPGGEGEAAWVPGSGKNLSAAAVLPAEPRGVRPRLEGKPRTPLSSRVATGISWSPLSGLKGVKPPVEFGHWAPLQGAGLDAWSRKDEATGIAQPK